LNPCEVDLIQVGLSVLRGVYSLMPYLALGLLLAILSRSVVVPVAGGLVAILIFESLIPQILRLLGDSWARLGLYLPQSLGAALMMSNRATSSISPAMSTPPVAPAAAALGIAAWTAVMLGLAFLAFRQQDLTG
jgi:ABC-type transport system involved in multi-copper enzyme maturation permease subunit